MKKYNERIYRIYRNMIKRCKYPSYKYYFRYGGRGIKVCESWNTFDKFYQDMKKGYSDGKTLDRIDNNGDYCKDNCKWSTPKEQCYNRSSNHWIEFDGLKLSITQWADLIGVKRTTLLQRINVYGWSIERALTTYQQ